MHFRHITSLSLVLLASLGTLAACSSDSDEPAPATSSSNTTRISAEEGGKVVDPSGKATLTIPAGALAEDTDITLSVSAATDETVAAIYDFGPDGLAFLKPAVLEIAVDAAAVGDEQVAVALETDGKFVALAGSSYADGVARAEIEHFSKFTVVAVLGKACEDEVKSFTACGGDIVGTWELVAGCTTQELDSECSEPEARVDVEIRIDDLIVTFADDGTWTQSPYTRTDVLTYTFPLSCHSGEGVDNCAKVSSEDDVLCTGEATCTCIRTDRRERDGRSGTYTVDSDTGQLLGGRSGQYCVSGDTLQMLHKATDSSGQETYRTLETYRKK